MNILDMTALGFENLRRTRLRTFLTVLGVVIGIGALTSMVSFGTGMQKNITDAFKQNDLFTSLYVTASDADLGEVMGGDPRQALEALAEEPDVALNDSTLGVIEEIAGVDIAFPEIRFPVRLQLGESDTRTSLQALPLGMAKHPPFNDLLAGEFFADDTASVAVIRWETLRSLGIIVPDPDSRAAAVPDTSADVTVVPADSVLGMRLDVHTAVIDPSRISRNPMQAILGGGAGMFSETVNEFTICGILKRQATFAERHFRGGLVVPMGTGRRLPRLGFSTVWDLLGREGRADNFEMVYVRAASIAETSPVREAIEDMGLNVVSITDQLQEIRRGFLIMDSILGAVGTIALFVAALGIVNTMVMSILERTREIGVMKAIGGSEHQIRMIFFVEAAAIGVVGAIFGLLLGWGVTRIANLVVNARLLPAGEEPVNLFYFPLWLILGAIAFAILLSLAAGLYPAHRAARVDPVKALRHD
jgi:putative ABC transport system permease protein